MVDAFVVWRGGKGSSTCYSHEIWQEPTHLHNWNKVKKDDVKQKLWFDTTIIAKK